MTPQPGSDLNYWLSTALTRYALGGISLGEVVKDWMESIPSIKKTDRLIKGLEDIISISETSIEESNPEIMKKIAEKALKDYNIIVSYEAI